jgi:NitT/TauT family transport system substrate-binding protein
MRKKIVICFFILLPIASLMAALRSSKDKEAEIRIGFFPNITHSQAIIGMSQGIFQKALGDNIKISQKVFNAGPSAIEAMFAGELDLAYIGPSPAINGYVKSKGQALKIIAGATSGGAALVVRSDANIVKVQDFHGKKIASPQLGNTQDVALRGWLKDNGLSLKDRGGDVQVLPINNPDQLTLFLKKEIDAAWAVEPWVSRLVKEGGGKVFLDERSIWPNGDFVTAHIIVSRKFLESHPDLVRKWVKAHIDVTDWINKNLPEAKKILNSELKRLTGKALPDEVLDNAFNRLKVTYDPIKSSLMVSVRWAFEQGFLGKEQPDITGIYDLSILNEALKEKGLTPIKD